MKIKDFLTRKMFPFLKFAKDEFLEKDCSRYIVRFGVFLEDEQLPVIKQTTIILN